MHHHGDSGAVDNEGREFEAVAEAGGGVVYLGGMTARVS